MIEKIIMITIGLGLCGILIAIELLTLYLFDRFSVPIPIRVIIGIILFYAFLLFLVPISA